MDPRGMRLRMLKRVLFPPEVCVGKGSLDRLGCLEPARMLVVMGSSARRTGTCERVRAQLRGAAAVEEIDLPSGDPTAAVIAAAGPGVDAFAPEWIVAVGGGTVLDASKFLWAQYEHPEIDFSGASPVTIGPLRQKARLIAIPTTAGSGSEASQTAVLSTADGTKVPFISAHWLPDVAILDPTLTVSLSRETTAATGFDVLAHAVESRVSSLGNAMLAALAATAVGLVLRHLPSAVENPDDLTAREGMLEAAFLAGSCQSMASTGAAHALSHATSKLHGTPHGAATGFYLLPTMRWNQARNPAVYDGLAVGCGLRDGAALMAALAGLASQVGQPARLADLLGRELDAADRQALAEAAARDVCLRTNPCRLAPSELLQLVSEIS